MKKICIIHAPGNHGQAHDMRTHLAMMVRNELIGFVNDVKDADFCAILLSAKFTYDDSAWSLSEEASRKNKAGMCCLLPIAVDYVAELPDHLANLQILPRNGLPANSDKAWAGIALEIRNLVSPSDEK